MLTSANHPRWVGCRAGLWLQNAAVKIGPAPLVPHLAPDAKGIMVWRLAWPSAAGYELAGHARPEQRGTALDRLWNVAVKIVGLSQRRTEPGRPKAQRPQSRPAHGAARRAAGAAAGVDPLDSLLRRVAGPVNDCSGSAAALGPSLTGPPTRHFCIQEVDASERRANRPATPLSIRTQAPIFPNFPLDNQSPIRARP